jgi:hypothetical protein
MWSLHWSEKSEERDRNPSAPLNDLVAELVSSLRLLSGRSWVRIPPGSQNKWCM